MLQILPVNDTRVYGTWWDSYPYKAISVFALHPLYLSLRELFSGKPPAELQDVIEAARHEGDESEAVDYEATLAVKLQVAQAVFDSPQGAACASGLYYSLRPACGCLLGTVGQTSQSCIWGLCMDSGCNTERALTFQMLCAICKSLGPL